MRDGHSTVKGEPRNPLSIRKLAEIKQAALRHHLWFRSLSRVERGIMDLTVRYVDSIKSTKLAKVVTAIIEKLQATMENKADKLTRTVGLPLARKISKIAVSWGNRSASIWTEDIAFARYLAFSLAKI